MGHNEKFGLRHKTRILAPVSLRKGRIYSLLKFRGIHIYAINMKVFTE